ncbi:MAG: hypothetical protein QXT45_04410 [Candidatus Bilamarchaeaceae archaeon]
MATVPINWIGYWLYLKDKFPLSLVTHYQFIVAKHNLPREIDATIKRQILGPAEYALISVAPLLTPEEAQRAAELLAELKKSLSK